MWEGQKTDGRKRWLARTGENSQSALLLPAHVRACARERETRERESGAERGDGPQADRSDGIMANASNMVTIKNYVFRHTPHII